MKDKIITTVCLLLMSATGLFAQETKQLTIQNAIELSIKNKNLQLANAKIAEVTGVLQAAYNNRLPDFKVSGSYIRLNSANVDLKTKSDSPANKGTGPQVSSAAYGIANLSFPIYAGGRIKYGIESAKLLEEASAFSVRYCSSHYAVITYG